MQMSDFESRPAGERSDAILQLHAAECAIRRTLVQVIAAHDRTESWKEDGATSMTAWLAAQLGVTHGTASQLVSVGAALEELPSIGEAFGEGRLSWDKTRSLTRFATIETDDALAEEAQGLSASQVQTLARRLRNPAEADKRTPSDRCVRGGTVTASGSTSWTYPRRRWCPGREGARASRSECPAQRSQSSVRTDRHAPCRCSGRYRLDSIGIRSRPGSGQPGRPRRPRHSGSRHAASLRSKPDPPLPLRRSAASPATPAFRPYWMDLTGSRSGSDERPAPFLPGSTVKFAKGIRDVGSPAVSAPAGSTPITWSTGPTEVQPISTTSSPCADITTASSTMPAGRSKVAPTETSSSSDPTAVPINQDPTH